MSKATEGGQLIPIQLDCDEHFVSPFDHSLSPFVGFLGSVLREVLWFWSG